MGGGLVDSFSLVVIYFSRFYSNSLNKIQTELKYGKMKAKKKPDLFSKIIQSEGIFFPPRVVDVEMLHF